MMPLQGILAEASLGAVGTAEFVFAPTECGPSTPQLQALSSDVIQVCQDTVGDGVNGFTIGAPGPIVGFFNGHSAFPLQTAGPQLVLGLPDQNLVFSEIGTGGPNRSYSPITFDSVVPGNPLSGVGHFSAGSAGTTFATVDQTLAVAAGASQYQLSYAITNTSGAPLRLRPVELFGYYGDALHPDVDPPGWSTSSPPRRVAMHSPMAGGSVTVTGSTAGGSPDITGFAAGSGQHVSGLAFAQAGALDSTLSPPDGSEGLGGSEMAVEWNDHLIAPLAAGATAHYTFNVALQQPRELLLALHDPAAPPTAGVATTFDATVTDDRPLAGIPLRWTLGPDSGEAVLDGAGKATFSIPPFTGSQVLVAYVDANADAMRDAGDELNNAFLAAGDAVAPAPLPPAPAPEPVPVPTATVPSPTKPTTAPALAVRLPSFGAQKLTALARSGLRVSATVTGPAVVTFRLAIPKRTAKKLRLKTSSSVFVLARRSVSATSATTVKTALRIPRSVLHALRHHTTRATLQATAVSSLGQSSTNSTTVVVRG